MSKGKLKISLVSDFTINPLQAALKKQFTDQSLEIFVHPIDQVRQSIDDICSAESGEEEHIVVLWTNPRRQIYEFVKLCTQNQFDKELIFQQVKEFSEYIRRVSKTAKLVIVPIWTIESNYRGNGILDFKHSVGIYNILMQMNLKLSESLDDLTNVFLLNTEQWIKLSEKAEDEKLWYLGKIPFTQSIFTQASEDIRAVYDAVKGRAKKLLVLDLDNILWGGILGEDGMQGIRLGGIDYIGEAYTEFQRHLLQLKNRGILLAVCSKNDEVIAMNVIENHSEMILQKDDFTAFKINWQDKAKNISELALELNLGLDSIVFIDDSPFERSRVASELPQVLVPEWPEDPIYYVRALNNLKCFDKAAFSLEDSHRTDLYKQEQERKKLVEAVGDIEQWLYQIELEVSYELVNENNIERVTQLFNKTNQFNLITRRMGQSEIMSYCSKENSSGVAFYARDRFGSYGLIGFCSFDINDSDIRIRDFLLSCRAMGRGIEKSMLYVIKDLAAKKLKSSIRAQFIPSGKNKACADFLTKNGFIKREDMYYRYNLEEICNPEYIKLISKN